MGYKYDEREILAAAVELALDEGLSGLSFGRLAKRIGIADRSIVYYFPTKRDLLTHTILAVGARLQAVLEDAVGDERVAADDLVSVAWPLLATDEADPVFGVFFELVGLGAASVAPYDELAPLVMEAWIEWMIGRIDATDADTARGDALAALATIDGLLFLRHSAGPEAADTAARRLGVI